MQNKYRIFLVLIATVFILQYIAFRFTASYTIVQSDKGCINLTNWDISTDQAVRIIGNKLEKTKDSDRFINTKSEHINDESVAVYKLHVKTKLHKDTRIGVVIEKGTAALFNSAGSSQITESQRYESIYSRPGAFYFNIPDSEFDIFCKFSGVIMQNEPITIFIGSPKSISQLFDNLILKAAYLYGALTIVEIFSLLTAIAIRRMRYMLLLSVYCSLAFFFSDLSGINVIAWLFPGLSNGVIMKALLSSLIWSSFVLSLYWYFQFISQQYHKIIIINGIITIAWQIVIMFLPLSVFYCLNTVPALRISMTGVIAAIIFGLNLVGLCTYDINSAWENVICCIIITVTSLLDCINMSSSIYILSNCFCYSNYAFLCIQMYILSKQISIFLKKKNTEELRFMQARMKPDFLFSIFKTYTSVLEYDPDNARNFLGEFTQYFRKTFDLKSGYDFVQLEEELSITKEYLQLEQIRLNKLEINCNVPEQTDIAVPAYMLQPVVENAVIHGLLPRKGGKLIVNIENQGNFLSFSVKDNGVGMSKEEIRRALYVSGENSLQNIEFRLHTLYKQYLTIESIPGEGTEIKWKINIKKGRRNDKSNID